MPSGLASHRAKHKALGTEAAESRKNMLASGDPKKRLKEPVNKFRQLETWASHRFPLCLL